MPPTPRLGQGEVTVDEAWKMFGIPQKRGARDDVRKRYLAFVAKHHPDKIAGASKKKQKEATERCARANVAWSLLEKHCRW
jgi:DnaJ-class molecular chaperone